MSVIDAVLVRLPSNVRARAIRHRELVKFACVGAVTFVVDNAVWYLLKLTILVEHPTTAKGIGILVATIVSYVLNREWSFRTRGGRERPHEAALFFAVSAAALIINVVPLYLSRYALDLQVPHVDRFTQEVADFASASVLGVALAMLWRFWAFRRWVFPAEFGTRG
ncbi:GtrA family protein [Saccharomonospora piscinae]|uniref:GtrA family protein n=1 Tax=Saccharomonospora piscinae TaxID=687388 RepID=UPI0004675E99|nr:GtrA family protein [Saccharomonospora piscinae]